MYVAPTESEALEARDAPELDTLIDALANGQFSKDEFVDRVLQCESTDPDAVWEVLALLDQNFRRKRIDRDTFSSLKSRLQRHSLGVQEDGQPVPRSIRPQRAAPAAPAASAEPAASAAPAAPAAHRGAAIPVPLREPAPRPMARPTELPLMHAVEPDPPDDLEQDAPVALVEASYHREVRAGDLLCGRYRAVEILRRRDWLTVLEAVDEPKAGLPGIRQRVALQVLDENLSQDTLLLQRIGKLQALSHPAITRLLDVEDDNGSLVLVTEFFSGVSLRTLLERRTDRRVPIQSALAIVRTLAGALAYAHAHGVAHGDLVAGNVLITELGDARLQGFELRAQSHAVQPGADRMAFARLAYELLAGTAEPVTALNPASLSRLRAPPGITRAQWRVLRAALSGRDGGEETGILAAFGGEMPAAGEAVLFRDESGAPILQRRQHVREWLAAGIVAAILGGGLFLYLQALPAADPPTADVTAPAAAPAQTPPATQAPPEVVTVDADAPRGTQVAPAPAEARPAAITARGDMQRPPALATTPQPAAPVTRPAPPARASIDLASTYAWVDTTEPVARIWVTRRGTPGREVTFRWWTETGTAQVGRDFRAIEPRLAVIPEGSRGVELLVPLMPDATRREPRTFYVKIDEPGPGADLGTRTLMQVAIVPPGYPAARDAAATTQNLAVAPP